MRIANPTSAGINGNVTRLSILFDRFEGDLDEISVEFYRFANLRMSVQISERDTVAATATDYRSIPRHPAYSSETPFYFMADLLALFTIMQIRISRYYSRVGAFLLGKVTN
jgi:hypothetical protein